MILVELRREAPERALELAREAGRVDEHGRTAGMLAYLGQPAVDAEETQPPPTRDDVESALAQSLSEHRRLHAEDHRLLAEDGLG
jgi:hypothetical protein